MSAPSHDRVDLPAWHVDIDGCTNFRDAGGWPASDGRVMRTRRLYRADDPLRLTAAGRAAVRDLGLVLVVDVRQDEQFRRGPGFLPAESTAHVPLVDQVINRTDPPPLERAEDLVELYDDMLERGRHRLAEALDLIAERAVDGPVLVHCVYGKDRAGLVTALVQAAIGVDAASIVDDFARSHEPSTRRRAGTLADPLPDDPDTSGVPEFLFSAPAETMRLLLERMIARHGSLDAWVASFPVRPDTIQGLRHAFLDD